MRSELELPRHHGDLACRAATDRLRSALLRPGRMSHNKLDTATYTPGLHGACIT